MKNTLNFKTLALGCLSLSLAFAGMSNLATAQDLPTAEKIVANFVKATGGAENHRAIKNIVSKGTISIPQFGIEGSMTLTQAAPNKMLMEMSFDQVGDQATGYNGEVAWMNSAMQGPQVFDGEQKEQVVVQSYINQYLDLSELFDSVECTGVEEFNDETCYVVVAKKEGMEPMTSFFSKTSKLLVGSRVVQVTPMGKMEATTVVSDYKKVGDVKMSHKAVVSLTGMTQEVTISSIEFNTDIPDDKFALPAEVAELVK